jgi:glycosyltransferase involved in cell wall biosynthesis
MISLVIPSRGESLGLWATVASAKSDLLASGEPFEIIAVVNGEPPGIASWMLREDFCRIIYSAASSPQEARHQGLLQAKSDFVFFADAHCVFPPRWFLSMREEADRSGTDAIFGGTRFLSGATYGMRLGWREYLWGSDVIYEKHLKAHSGELPAPIAIIGHGAFGIRKRAYLESGGYWLALRGFGGEETQLNLKLWMMSFRCHVTPRCYHWHYSMPGERRGPELFNGRQFVRNFLMIAAAYGGPERVQKSHHSFCVHYWKNEDLYPGICEEVLSDPAVAEERAFVDANCRYKNLEELRAMFDAEGVIH